MTDLKCARCGTDLLVADQVCRFCTIEMDSVRTHSPAVPFINNQPRPVHVYESNDPTNSSIGPFHSVGDVLGPTFRLFINNLWLITKLVLVVFAPLEGLKVMSMSEIQNDWQFQTGTFLLQILCGVLVAPALIFALMKVMQTGVAPGVNQSYRWGFGKFGKLLVCTLISWLIAFPGYLLCILPGVVISVMLSLVYPLAVLENRSSLEVLGDSKQMTLGHRWNIFLAGLVIYGLIALVNFALAAGVGSLAITYNALWIMPLVEIIGDILGQMPTILSLVMYLSIRVVRQSEFGEYAEGVR